MDWFIQLHKKICEWEWYTDIPTKTLFFHILLKCNYKEAKWKWKTIKPWEFITSLEHLSLETWLSRQQVRTAIEKLKKTWEVTHQATNDYTMLGLNNWETYNTRDNTWITNEQQTSNKRITTTNKEYKEKKEYKWNHKLIEDRMEITPNPSIRYDLYKFILSLWDRLQEEVNDNFFETIETKLLAYAKIIWKDSLWAEIDNFILYHKAEKTVFKSTLLRLNTWFNKKITK